MVQVKTASVVPISFKPINKPRMGHNGYDGFHPGKVEYLKKGQTRKATWDNLDGKPLGCDITLEHDVEIVVRDGTKIYADILRPTNATEKVPVILSFGPYGKKYNGHGIAVHLPWHCGLNADDMSGWETFEGVDPAEFCPWGYAVANVDSRGTGNSEGYIEIMSEQDSQDGYDIIEFLAKQEWCNGAVGMAGNSHLAIVQYFVAAQRPPSLKAIAPWEACSDLAREQFTRGGIFYISNNNWIVKYIMQGQNGYEDFEEMYERYPLAGPYWDSKRAPLAKIPKDMPVFLTGTDFASMHTMGSIRGWMQIDSKHKWIKWNAYHEWYDLWAPEESRHELRDFFDRYLKGKDNDWEKTPRCRWSVLQYGDKEPIENIPLPDYPHPDTKYTEFYLTGDHKLTLQPTTSEATLSYDSEAADFLTFEHTFEKDTTLLGIPKIFLYMSCKDHNDMNVYIRLRKKDKNGTPLVHIPFPRERWGVKSMYDMSPEQLNHSLIAFKGQTGMLRASHRKIDRSKTYHPQIPFHPHDEVQTIPPGEIVELEIGIFAGHTHYEAGETLVLEIYGFNAADPQFADINKPRPAHEQNHGKHFVHIGKEHQARIILPVVDLKL